LIAYSCFFTAKLKLETYSTMMVSVMTMFRSLATVFCLLGQGHGFAYAPNFITKIVQEQTGIKPTGLLEIEGAENVSGDTGKQAATVDRPVMTRFPPEPNGYLHLGHAKAVCFNFAVARMFGGTCNMRMDDTNPSKEDEEYVESILKDVKWIQSGLYQGSEPWDGDVKKTSDYFDIIYDAAVALIKQGDAYVDSLSAEEMREYRGTLTEPGKNSPFRTRSIQENLELFEGVSTSPTSFQAADNNIGSSDPPFESRLCVQDESWQVPGRRVRAASQN
jgi:tRNA synthetases class I (E and Q), catalytic domain